MSGSPIIYVDNVPETVTFEGSFLEQTVSSDAKKSRVLGYSKNVKAPNVSIVAVTGNNLKIGPDTLRRTLPARLITDSEDPFLKSYPFDPVLKAKEMRGELVTAVNTFMLYHYQNPPKDKPVALGSFEEWSDTVRSALIAAGEPDPVGAMLEERKLDPAQEQLRNVAESWHAIFGYNELTLADFATEVLRGASDDHLYLREEFRLSSHNDKMANRAVGDWLKVNSRIVDKRKFVPGNTDKKTKNRMWRLVRVEDDENGVKFGRWSPPIEAPAASNATPSNDAPPTAPGEPEIRG